MNDETWMRVKRWLGLEPPDLGPRPTPRPELPAKPKRNGSSNGHIDQVGDIRVFDGKEWKAQAPTARAIQISRKLTTAVVHLKTDQVIKGAVARVGEDAIILKHASLATQGPSGSVTWTGMDGEIVITLDNVDFWQDGLNAALLDRTLDIPTK